MKNPLSSFPFFFFIFLFYCFKAREQQAGMRPAPASPERRPNYPSTVAPPSRVVATQPWRLLF
jgi:hypothetical protein